MTKQETHTAIKYVTSKVQAQTGESGEERLMVAIFERALLDLLGPDTIRENKIDVSGGCFYRVIANHDKISSKAYLRGDMFNLQLAGIEIPWVHRLFKSSGVWDIITAPTTAPPRSQRQWQAI